MPILKPASRLRASIYRATSARAFPVFALATLALTVQLVAQPPAALPHTADPHAQAGQPGTRPTGAEASSEASSLNPPHPASAQTTAQTCASCHPSQAHTQPLTPMGRALELPADNPTLRDHPSLSFHRGAYTYTIATTGGKSTYTVTDGAETITLPIKWSVGVGGQTWVLERNGKLYESLVSFYPAISGLDITTGDEILKPATLETAMGRELSKDDGKACFGCHATNVLTNGNLNLEALQPGITCQHCHEGALLHATDANQGGFETVPPKLGLFSTEKLSNYCGQCHRTWEMVVRNHWRGPSNVRFQAYRLANSRCFDGTDPRISCVACHNPHQDLSRVSTSYDVKCLACHAPPITAGGAAPATLKTASQAAPAHNAPTREQAKVCPVAKSDCTSCHMPKIVFPGGGGHLSFSDHYIRVVKPGEAYPD